MRNLDVSGEITASYAQDLEAHGREVRKIRALRQLEGLEWIQNLREVIEGTDPDAVRESRHCDRLPLTTWSDSKKRVVLLGDGERELLTLSPTFLIMVCRNPCLIYLVYVCSCSWDVFRPRTRRPDCL